MIGLFNPYFIGDSVMLEAVARKLSEETEVAIISSFPELFIAHPVVKAYTLDDMPEDVNLIDMANAIKGIKQVNGENVYVEHKIELMCQEVQINIADIKQPELYLTPEEQQESKRLRDLNGGTNVGVVLESRHQEKDWAYMGQLVKSLTYKYHVHVIGQGIKERYPYLQDLNITYIDNVSLRQLMVHISALDMVIGVDTGPMHIAGALHIPTVVIGFENYGYLYGFYENCQYLNARDLKTINIRKVYKACKKPLKASRVKHNGKVGIMLLEGLGGTVTLSDHAKKLYEYCGRKPYLIIRKYKELFEENPYIEGCIEVGMLQYEDAIRDMVLKFDVLICIKTGVGKWYIKGKEQKQKKEFKEIYDNHPMGSNKLEKYKLNLIQTANKSLGLPYEKIECGIFKYEDIGITLPEKYIVVSNGVDVWHKGIRQTKSWEHDEWERLVKLLDYPVVQVGTKYDQHIEGVIDLRQYTTIQQLLSLLKKATAIICTEGGLMHLGNAVGNPNVFVLRGPTSGYLFSYPEQYKIDTRICQPCYWDNGEWYRECPKGLDNVCMKSIKAERVYGVIKGVLDEPLAEVSNITQLLVDDSVFGTTESVTEAYAGV